MDITGVPLAEHGAIAPRPGRKRPEVIAALVNGSLVLLLPLAWVAYAGAMSDAVMPSWAHELAAMTLATGLLMSLAMPFALVVVWRTFVHAKRYLANQDSGWAGVLEGGAVGCGAAVLILLPATIMRPLDAPPYLITYGGGAAVVGLVLGFILRLTAVLVLRLASRG